MRERPLELVDVGHTYPGQSTPVVGGVNLAVEPGELVAILGASGCGKTTLLRSIAGLVTPSHGAIRIGGRDVARDGRDLVPVEARRIGLVFQEYALFPYMTVLKNIEFGVGNDEGLVARLIDLLGLSGLEGRRPSELSGGQQQRVALARALAPQPALLLLDEPYANVDASLKAQLGMELSRILDETGASAVMVTHDQADAMAHADRLAVLESRPEGAAFAQVAAPDEAYHRPTNRGVALSLGPGSFLPAQAQGATAKTVFGAAHLVEPANGEVTLLLRPEHARFVPSAGGDVAVIATAYLGRSTLVTVEREGTQIVCECDQLVVSGAEGRVELSQPLWALD